VTEETAQAHPPAPETEPPVQVTVLLPAHNEHQALPGVLAEVDAVMAASGYSYEIMVVDDASTDDTAEIARNFGARVIVHGTQRGSGAARRTGILAARGEIIVMLDADGTYDPPTIPAMLAHFPEYDQVNGARTSEQGTHKAIRTVAKELIRRLAQYLSESKIPDLNTGLKAFKREVMLKYLWVLPDGFSCVTTMTLAFLCNGHPVKYVPTPYRKRTGGHSKFHPIKDSSKYLQTVVRMATYFRPLRVFGPLSVTLLLVGLATSAFNLLRPEKTSLEESDIILICTGLLIGAIGLLADLIVATRRQ
jgi:glycosyltransferase involved in cell wall biosynthesis